MPWLLFIIYICLGMNNELNAFYDYTLMHMLSGIVIGRVYVFLAYEKKLLAANWLIIIYKHIILKCPVYYLS